MKEIIQFRLSALPSKQALRSIVRRVQKKKSNGGANLSEWINQAIAEKLGRDK